MLTVSASTGSAWDNIRLVTQDSKMDRWTDKVIYYGSMISSKIRQTWGREMNGSRRSVYSPPVPPFPLPHTYYPSIHFLNLPFQPVFVACHPLKNIHLGWDVRHSNVYIIYTGFLAADKNSLLILFWFIYSPGVFATVPNISSRRR